MTGLSSARTLALLRRIHDRHGPQAFGRIGQTLLALSFHSQGFKVTKNPIGVPDILARRENPLGGFALEAKTSEGGKVSLQKRELKGLLDSGLTPTLAALSFPDRDPEWLFVEAHDLLPGIYEMVNLARRRRVDIGFDANFAFRTVLAQRIDLALDNPEDLEPLLR